MTGYANFRLYLNSEVYVLKFKKFLILMSAKVMDFDRVDKI